MAKLTFPPFPQSLKNWTPKDRQRNHFAIRSFRDVADADYIAARLAYRAQLPVQFLWASQQTLEKSLKFTPEPYGRSTFAIRTSVPPATLVQSVVAAIRAIDLDQPVAEIRTMTQRLDEKTLPQRFSALLLGAFAGVALLLAAVGIFSVLSYIVRGRRREIGIRSALGAQRADVLRLVIVEGMSPALFGVAAGTIAAFASAKVLKTLVFGVSASDPLTLAAVGATLTVVALMASAVPAYRALQLDPVKALRAE